MDNNSWIVCGGRVVDPALSIDEETDLLIVDGRIAAIGRDLPAAGAQPLDAGGAIVAPGFVDLHVHLRDPGFEYKETLATGTLAAAAGGFTTVCCMPNTRPALDGVEIVRDLIDRAERDGVVRVYPIATITKGRIGEEAVDFEALAAAGAIAFSDDGDTTRDSLIMRHALEASLTLDLPIMVHCEDKALARGSMHEGEISRKYGASGIPSEAEEIIIARDLMLTRLTGGWLHVCHVSTGRGIDMIRRAKAEGTRVTAEVMPHHLAMSDEWVGGSRSLHNVSEPSGAPAQPLDPNTKVNPPLRPVADTRLLLEATIAGDFDVIATDHAPHAVSDKEEKTFEAAAFGLSGSEFALPTMLAFVRAGHLTINDLIFRMSNEPGRLLNKGTGSLVIGSPADVVILDPNDRWLVGPATIKSKSANTPLIGMELQGRARYTLVDGQVRFHV